MATNEVSIVITADTNQFNAQLAGLRQQVELAAGSGGTLKSSIDDIHAAQDRMWGVGSGSGPKAVQGTQALSIAQQEAAQYATLVNSKNIDWNKTLEQLSGGPGGGGGGSLGAVEIGANLLGGVLSTVVSAGFTAASAAAAAMVVANVSLIQTQADVKRAIDSLDFKAAETGFANAVAQVYALNIAQQTLAERSFTDGGFKGIASWFIIIKDLFVDSPGQAAAYVTAMEKIWASFGVGNETLKVTNLDLEAQNKHLTNIAGQATSLGELTTIYGQQEDVTRALAKNSLDLAKNEATRQLDAGRANAQELIDIGKTDAGMTALGLAVEKYSIAQSGFAAQDKIADEAAAARKQANAEKVAGFAADQVISQGKINDIYKEIDIQSVKTAQAEEDGRFKAAKANATFYGTAAPDAERYYGGLSTTIETLGALEIKKIEARRDSDILALKLRRDALPANSLAWQKLNDDITLADATAQLAIQKKSAETTLALAKYDQAKVESVKLAYADIVGKSETFYKTQEGLGQGNVAEHLRQLASYAYDENLSYGDRQKFAVAAYAGFQKFDDDLFKLRKTLGLTNQTDEVARLADLVTKTGEGSQARIKAETEWAAAATKLREDASKAGVGFIEAITRALKAEGLEEVTLGDVYAGAERIRTQALSDTRLGMGLTVDRFKEINVLSGAFNDLTKLGIDPQTGIAAAIEQTQRNLTGMRGPFGDVNQGLNDMGAAASGLAPKLNTISQDFADLGPTLGTSLDQSLEAARGTFQQFWRNLATDAEAGQGPVVSGLVGRVVTALRQALDAESWSS